MPPGTQRRVPGDARGDFFFCDANLLLKNDEEKEGAHDGRVLCEAGELLQLSNPRIVEVPRQDRELEGGKATTDGVGGSAKALNYSGVTLIRFGYFHGCFFCVLGCTVVVVCSSESKYSHNECATNAGDCQELSSPIVSNYE